VYIYVQVVYSVSFLTPYIFKKEGVGLYSDFRGGSKTWQKWADLKEFFFCQILLPPKIRYINPPPLLKICPQQFIK
jgi:hypothetical protein